MDGHMSRLGIRIATVGSLALLLVPPAFAEAQGRNAPPGPVALRRIAEALDGHRSGDQVWVVASRQPPFDVVGVFGNEREAAQRLRALGSDFMMHGPNSTERDPASEILGGCVHIRSSRMKRDLCVPPTRGPIPLQDIRTMTLVITRTNGSVDSLPIARDADAIFLSLPAIDKFAVPYYTGIIGLAATSEMRREVAGAFVARPRQRGAGGSDK
jgi:hypothetical protein